MGKTVEFLKSAESGDLGPLEWSIVKAAVYTRFAAGLENKEEGHDREDFSFGTHGAWRMAGVHLAEVLRQSPEEAFSLALQFILLPHGEDAQKEATNAWMRTSGLSLLAEKSITPLLTAYLENGEFKQEIANILTGNLVKSIYTFKELEDFDDPQGFSTTQAVVVGLTLHDATDIQSRQIYSLAAQRKNNPDIQQAARVLVTIPGCEYFRDLVGN